MKLEEKIKESIWRKIYHFFLKMQNFLLRTHVIRHDVGRQPYHIGWLAPGKTLEDLKLHLHKEWGFGNHFVAWTDNEQVLSWRKLINFNEQYHIRVFSDGEIRGHYEYTPEGHPIDHLTERGEKDAKKEFLDFLGEYVVTEKYISNLAMDPNAYNPDSELTIENQEKLD